MNDLYSEDDPAQKDEPVSTRDNQDCVNVVSHISIFYVREFFMCLSCLPVHVLHVCSLQY